ncbi:cytochrome P450 [soil metagenome]|nr:cytochrome P450 [Gemmatimonadota bacterium]
MVTLKPRFPGELILLAQRDPLALFQCMAAAGGERGGEMVRAGIGPRELFLLNHPDLVRALLAYTGDALIKERALRLSRIVLGTGLVTSDGALHRQQRRLLLPGFHQRQVAASAEVMVALTQQRAAGWRPGEVIAVDTEMMRLTLEIAAKALFGAELRGEVGELQRAVLIALTIFDRHRNPFAELLNRLPLPATVRVWRARRRIEQTVRRFIQERREGGTASADILSLLLAARDEETGIGLTDAQIRDEIVTLLLTGHETTAVALTWTWYFLARHPGVEARLHAEVDAVCGERSPTFDDVKTLTYTRQVVSEALRLRPPVWAVSRQAVAEVEIGDYLFPRGATLVVCQYALHRDPAWWREPERFRPERFAAEAEPPLRKFTYLPFSGGPRGCIGEHFAWTECILVVAALARRWRLQAAEEEPIGLRPSITLRPDRPVRMRLVRR